MKPGTTLLLVLAMMLVACSKPLPADKRQYAGEWASKEMDLVILADGSVSYARLKDGATVTVKGPIKEFQGNDFVVGIGPLSTTFEVSEPPHKVKDDWQMVVDGVRLRKVSE